MEPQNKDGNLTNKENQQPVKYGTMSGDVNLGFEGDDSQTGNSRLKIERASSTLSASLNNLAVGLEEREQWGSQVEFILATMGYAVGIGNVWRFPYLAYENGGGSFLIPYTIMLLFAGLPLFFMEFSIGQYFKKGPLKVFQEINPLAKGLGIAMMICTMYVAIYYNIILAWTIFYMVSGFASELPWIDGNNVSKTEQYFNDEMLGRGDDITWSNFGTIKWQLVICLAGAWLVVCGALVKGVKGTGKVVYFTVLFPYVILIVFFINGLRLEGASKGIMFYITPEWDKLADVTVWHKAANQIFFSLGITWGGHLTMASFNKFNNNCHRDAILVAFVNCGTSVFAGFVVFSYLGYMADQTGQKVEEVVKSGPALAFIVYPEAMSTLPVPQLWSFLFFFMLFLLGLDSMFGYTETLVTGVTDQFKCLESQKHWVVIATCSAGFLLGLSMVTEGGVYLLTLLDAKCASWNMTMMAIFEIILVAWVYGTDKLFDNISEMEMQLPKIVKMYWWVCWKFVTPALLMAMAALTFMDKSVLKYNNYEFPYSIQIVGWVIGASSVMFIPLFALYACVMNKTS